MIYRLRIVQGATGLLYIGPLLAGFGGAGLAVVPVFVAIFLLWLIVLRPQDWPGNLVDWQRPDAWFALLVRVIVQIVLVLLCFGIGRGFAGVTDLMTDIPAWLPVALSIGAVALGRLAWPVGQDGAMELFLDQALASIHALDASKIDPAARADRLTMADRMLQPLMDLPDTTAIETICAHLTALAPHVAPDDLFDCLQARLQGVDPAPGVLRRAIILHATSPQTVEACAGRAVPVVALRVAGRDSALLRLFAERCRDLLDQHVDAWGECPNQAALEAARRGADGPAAEALARLIAMNRSLAPLAAEGT
jgi:hypothetical protein